MTARQPLLFSYDTDKQIFYYSLLCIYINCSKVSQLHNTGVEVNFFDTDIKHQGV